ncbi:MAG TPA: HAD-IA family hydrolase [Chitinophagaceae bacterium]|jgi:putative hydrolase of the HAD superfamily|nr:HAD-IA family hydrolase [Chitinophagaceae bacterium]
MITTFFLDIGGVLLSDGWNRKSRAEAVKIFGLNAEEMEGRHHLTFDTYEVGKISLDTYLDRIVFHDTRDFGPQQFKEFMFAQSSPHPEMIALIKTLKQKYNLKVAVVSNEGRELTEYRIKKFKLGQFVDFFISSCFVHFRKPDTDIFNLALDVSQVSPHEVVYIEDRPLFVQVAETLGINGVHHEGIESTRQILEQKFGLIA